MQNVKNPNDTQVGGGHYKRKAFQHWDMVCDTVMPYLLACATKYVSRWDDKNGAQDIEKAIHYLIKAKDKNICMSFNQTESLVLRRLTYSRYTEQFGKTESMILWLIYYTEFDKAICELKELHAEILEGAGSNYTNQD